MIKNKKIGLALSGGGYRAAAFHLGTLRKLNELGVLEKIDVISCISGGSIVGAYYCLYKDRKFEDIENSFTVTLEKSVTIRLKILIFLILSVILLLVGFVWWMGYPFLAALTFMLCSLIFFKYQFRLLPSSTIVEKIYDKFFFDHKTIKDLSKKPSLLINATNLETGRLWTFSQEKMTDSKYEYWPTGPIRFEQTNFPIARAVASSTCVPFAFSPVRITKKYFKNSKDYDSIYPRLIDGGVYDNQGLHKITQPSSSYRCDIIIVSDAGIRFSNKSIFTNSFTLLMKTSDIFMQRIKNLQFQHNIYYKNLAPQKEIAYISLSWQVAECLNGFVRNLKNGNISNDLLEFHQITSDEVENFDANQIIESLKKSIQYPKIQAQILELGDKFEAQRIPTDLAALSAQEIVNLSNHAAVITEIQLKLYCPSLFDIDQENSNA